MGLKLNNATKIAIISFFSSFYLYNHLSTLYLQAQGLSLMQTTTIWSLIITAMLVAEVPTGIVADHIGRKKSVIIAVTLQLLGEVLFYFASSYVAFMLIGMLAGIGFAFASGCIEALIYDTLPTKNRDIAMQRAMGTKSAAMYAAFFLAPLVGSLISPTFSMSGFRLLIAISAGSVAIALVLSFTLQKPQKEYEQDEQSPLTTVKQGITLVRDNKQLKWLTAVSIFTASFAGTLGDLFQPYFQAFQLTASHMGLATALAAALAFLVQKNIHRVEPVFGQEKALFITAALPALGYLLMAGAPTANVAFTAYLFTYAASDAKNPLLSSYQNQHIPERIRATTLSFVNLLSSLYVALMGIILGWLADKWIMLPFFLAGTLIFVASCILKLLQPNLQSSSKINVSS